VHSNLWLACWLRRQNKEKNNMKKATYPFAQLGTKPNILMSEILILFGGSTPKNDLRTKRKSKKPTICSENEIEKCH